MTVYAPLSVPAVNLAVGGCGKAHTAKKGERLSVTCATCEETIRKYFTGWGDRPEGAALTEEEEEQRQADQEKGAALTAAAGVALGELVAERVAGTKRKAG